MNNTPEDFQSAVRNHLTSFLGAPNRVVNIDLTDPELPFTKLEVAIFNHGTEHPTILSTCGLCLNQILDGRRMELVFIVDDHNDSSMLDPILNLMGTMAVFSTNAVPPLNYGGMLGARDQLNEITNMEGVIFFPPFMLVNDFHHFQAPDGSPVQLLWVVPIYEDEAGYADEHGPRELANLIGANQINLTDLQRPVANTEMTPEQVQQFLNPAAGQSSNSNQRSPHEITPEQIAQFRQSNEIVINVGHKYRPKVRPAPPVAVPQNHIEEDTSVLADNPAKPKSTNHAPEQPVRFNLDTGKTLNKTDKVPAGQKAQPKRAKAVTTPKVDPKEEKRKRIEALKAAAKAAKNRAQ